MKVKYLLLILICGIILGCSESDGDYANREAGAVDFDVNGLKLGMNASEVKSKIHNCKDDKFNVANRQILRSLECGKTLNANTKKLYISFDNKRKIINITKYKFFTAEPNYESIQEQLYKKYGRPDKKAQSKSTRNEDITEYLCWGDCIVKTVNNSSWTGERINYSESKKSLLIEYNSYVNNNSFYITYILRNGKDYNLFLMWLEKARKAYKTRNNNSSLDL